MANMKQQIKRYKNDNKKRAKNASYKSALKTAIKNVRAEVEAGNKEAAEKALVIASSKLDSYVNKGIHHKNYAIRQKSKLAKLVNSIKSLKPDKCLVFLFILSFLDYNVNRL